MADSRTYIKLDDHFDENPKIVGLPDTAFRLFVTSLCYCSRNLTDGVIPRAAIERLGGRATIKATKVLLEVGLWEKRGNDYAIHDYLEHQRSREQIENERRKARERAAKSRRTSRVTSDEVREPEAEATTEANNPPTPQQAGGRTKSLRSNGNSPRQVAARRAREKLELEIRECPECGGKSWNCTRCDRRLRQLEAV